MRPQIDLHGILINVKIPHLYCVNLDLNHVNTNNRHNHTRMQQ